MDAVRVDPVQLLRVLPSAPELRRRGRCLSRCASNASDSASQGREVGWWSDGELPDPGANAQQSQKPFLMASHRELISLN